MGWWSSSTPAPPVPNPGAAPADPQGEPSEPAASARETDDAAGKASKSVEEELAAFLPVFDDYRSGASATTRTQGHGISADAPRRSERDTPSAFAITYPRSMSCRDSFDRAFFCRNLGGRFTSLYRYGETRDCGEHWSEFWFCMRAWQKAPQVRAEMIQEFYRERDEEKYAGKPSSEDVWRQRRERVSGAFGTQLQGTVELVDVRRRRRRMGAEDGREVDEG